MTVARSRIAWAAAIGAVVLAGGLGYTVGHSSRGPVFTVETGLADASPSGGTAYLGAAQRPNRASTGFAYLLPADPPWIDNTGAIHDGGPRASCLPSYHPVRVKMETVKFPIGGAYQGTVLWVQC